MIIKQQIYDEIISKLTHISHETGGILGSVNGIIAYFIFDEGLQQEDKWCYYPNTQKLNEILFNWNQENIKFCGIVHSHINNQTSLSNGDILYIKEILLSMTPQFGVLYFPIVANGDMISHKVRLVNGNIYIDNDSIKFDRREDN